MILLTLLAQATAIVGPPSPAAPPMPPQDWSTLPLLAYGEQPQVDDSAAMFVRDEVNAGRCAAATRAPDGWTITVDLAALVDPGGRVRRLVPRAIQCPTVEQFAAGVVSRALRDNVRPTGANEPVWRKTAMRFAWR